MDLAYDPACTDEGNAGMAAYVVDVSIVSVLIDVDADLGSVLIDIQPYIRLIWYENNNARSSVSFHESWSAAERDGCQRTECRMSVVSMKRSRWQTGCCEYPHLTKPSNASTSP